MLWDTVYPSVHTSSGTYIGLIFSESLIANSAPTQIREIVKAAKEKAKSGQERTASSALAKIFRRGHRPAQAAIRAQS